MRVKFLQTVFIDDAQGNRRKMTAGQIVDSSMIAPGCLDSCLTVKSACEMSDDEGEVESGEQTSVPPVLGDELGGDPMPPESDKPGKPKGKPKGKKKDESEPKGDDLG